MPNLRHAFVNPQTDGSDGTITRPSNWNAPLVLTDVDGSPGSTQALVQEVLTDNRVYYVRTGGSDVATVSGLIDTDADAWATLAYALARIAKEINFNNNQVTVQLESGMTLIEQVVDRMWVGGGYLAINFNGNTVSSASSNPALLVGPNAAPGAITLSNFTVETSGGADGLTIFGPNVVFIGDGVVFGDVGTGAHVDAQDGSTVYMFSSYAITGSASYHLLTLAPPNYPSIYHAPPTVTITGTPNFDTGFAVAQSGSILSTGVTFVGGATGPRYSVSLNGVIQTFSGGANYFPGNVAGSTATGGQYA